MNQSVQGCHDHKSQLSQLKKPFLFTFVCAAQQWFTHCWVKWVKRISQVMAPVLEREC